MFPKVKLFLFLPFFAPLERQEPSIVNDCPVIKPCEFELYNAYFVINFNLHVHPQILSERAFALASILR